MKIVLTIAGSDPTAGAGLQADLKTIAAHGAYGVCAVTAVTAQGSAGLTDCQPMAGSAVAAQMRAPFVGANGGSERGAKPDAAKSGMLGTAEVVGAVADQLDQWSDVPYVLDPVFFASAGGQLLDDEGIDLLRRRLLPRATVVTPNATEASRLAGMQVTSLREAERAGAKLLELGVQAALITGGHLAKRGTDLLVTAAGSERFAATNHVAGDLHGTGCMLSAAIATLLAQGATLRDAVARAKAYVEARLTRGPFAGIEIPLADHRDPWLHPTEDAGQVPRLQVITDTVRQSRFGHLQLAQLAAEGGADLVQLRDKHLGSGQLLALAQQITAHFAGRPTRLLINDRVDVALASRTPAVHLGRADLPPAVARRLLGPKALIGATANNLAEVIALRDAPVDYLGVGPVFGTGSKENPAETLHLAGLKELVVAATQPVIAIGNISAERIPELLACGAHGVALLSAVVCSADPAAATARCREVMDASLPSKVGRAAQQARQWTSGAAS